MMIARRVPAVPVLGLVAMEMLGVVLDKGVTCLIGISQKNAMVIIFAPTPHSSFNINLILIQLGELPQVFGRA
jgi:hypothetical protein